MKYKHFLDISDFCKGDYEAILSLAARIKDEVRKGIRRDYLKNYLLTTIFEKASTRTRASFFAALAQSGGNVNEMNFENSQISRGESLADTAMVLSQYSDAIVLRVKEHNTLKVFAEHAHCPIINGLSEKSHPCQILADALTYQELRGSLFKKHIAWIGDCSNVAFSWAEFADLYQCRFVVACPKHYRQELPGAVEFTDNPLTAAQGADLIMTDTWISMGDEDVAKRQQHFSSYCVDANVMKQAKKEALFMHCLPAHRGEEVSAEVIDSTQSAIWPQANNRLHAQKALLIYLLGIET